MRAGSATYRVTRRVDDGPRAGRELLEETTQTGIVDVEPPGGVPVRYEVRTVREGAVSVCSADTPPVVVLPAVRDLAAEPGDNEVWLRWMLPAGAVGVRLRREHGGVVVDLPAGTTTAHDPSARSGDHYLYAVEAGYDVGGERRYATAAVVAARPQAVRQLANQYAEIGYFAVSALDAFGAAPRASARTGPDVHNDPPSAPLRWLLAERTAA